jgi:hypothetical protein
LFPATRENSVLADLHIQTRSVHFNIHFNVLFAGMGFNSGVEQRKMTEKLKSGAFNPHFQDVRFAKGYRRYLQIEKYKLFFPLSVTPKE